MTARTGRPREFNTENALEAAMRVFWSKGYEGATMTDLTEAMGINRSSMYAAFGCKQTLFIKVLARYRKGPLSYMARATARPTVGEVIRDLLFGTVELLANPNNPGGCLSIQGALTAGEDAQSARDELIDFRKAGELSIELRLQRAWSDGDLDNRVDPRELSRHLSLLMAGLAVQAVNGAGENELRRSAEMAIGFLGH
jgi:AcrR family transcriptional regulator